MATCAKHPDGEWRTYNNGQHLCVSCKRENARRSYRAHRVLKTPRLTVNATVEDPSDTQIAWAAGIFEGEGSVSHKGIGSQQAQIGQVDPELLYRLQKLFGGSVADYRYKTGYKPGDRRFLWSVNGEKARRFLGTIYSYLTDRRKRQVRPVLFAHLAIAEN